MICSSRGILRPSGHRCQFPALLCRRAGRHVASTRGLSPRSRTQNTLGSAHAARPDARLTPGRATALFSCQRPGLLRPRGRLQSPGKGRCYHQIANGKGVPSWSFLRSPARVARNSCPTCFPSLLGRARSRTRHGSPTKSMQGAAPAAICISANRALKTSFTGRPGAATVRATCTSSAPAKGPGPCSIVADITQIERTPTSLRHRVSASRYSARPGSSGLKGKGCPVWARIRSSILGHPHRHVACGPGGEDE